ncbi:MAG: 2TM domain-containing protein [Maribacter sp.]
MARSKKEVSKFERAQLRIGLIRGFYNHVGIFVLINVPLFLLKEKLMAVFVGEIAYSNSDVTSWVHWNIYIWMIILGVHAVLVFGNISFLGKKWEERQIEKYMKEDNH